MLKIIFMGSGENWGASYMQSTLVQSLVPHLAPQTPPGVALEYNSRVAPKNYWVWSKNKILKFGIFFWWYIIFFLTKTWDTAGHLNYYNSGSKSKIIDVNYNILVNVWLPSGEFLMRAPLIAARTPWVTGVSLPHQLTHSILRQLCLLEHSSRVKKTLYLFSLLFLSFNWALGNHFSKGFYFQSGPA